MTFDVSLYDTVFNKHWKSVTVSSSKVEMTRKWCEKNISARRYWIRNDSATVLGGADWKIWFKTPSSRANVFVADERYLTLIGLL